MDNKVKINETEYNLPDGKKGKLAIFFYHGNEDPRFHLDNAVKAYLASNADERGTDGFNLQLSLKRAKAATDYLVAKGIKKDRIKAKGFGKAYSIYSNKLAPVTEDEYKKDRRVDIYTADK